MTEYKVFEVTIPVAVDTEAVAEGFIDDKKSEEFATQPTSVTEATLKEQANMRWEEILKAMKDIFQDAIVDIVVTTGDRDDADVAPTVMAFKIRFMSTQPVWMYDLVTDPTGLTIYGPAEANLVSRPGFTYTTATELLVIERAIATALSQDAFTDPREVVDNALTRYSNVFIDVTVAPFGTGGTHALRMASVEGVGTLTVAQLY